MPFDPTTGIYTPPSGAENATPSQVIRSATWNSIFTDISDALSQLGQQSWVTNPRIHSVVGNFTVAAADSIIYVEASAPTITLPLSASKEGPVRLLGAAAGIFGTNNSVIVCTGGETISGLSSYTLAVNYGVLTLYPLSSGGYLFS